MLDARDESELLAMGAKLASLFAFYDLDSTRESTFAPFFQVDGQIYAALIATFPLPDFRHFFAAAFDSSADAALDYGVYMLLRLWRTLDTWAKEFPDRTPLERVRESLRFEIASQISPAVQAVLSVANSADLRADTLEMLHTFARQTSPELWGGLAVVNAPDAAAAPRDPLTVMRRSAALTLAGVTAAIGSARTAIAALSPDYGRAPQVALYLAFIRQFSHFRARLNQLPTRHLDFYYRRVLGQTERAGRSEYCWVAFDVKPNMRLEPLAAGAQLCAANGAGPHFKTLTQVALSQARIVTATTVAVIRGADDTPSLRVDTTPVLTPNRIDARSAGWHTFGPGRGESAAVSDSTVVSAGALGVVVAAPVLQDIDGERTVTLVITPAPTPSMTEALYSLPAQSLFDVQVSSGEIWLAGQPVPQSVNASSSSDLTLQFMLPASMPAAKPPAPSVREPSWPTDVPLLKLLAHPNLGGTALSSLSALRIERITLQLSAAQVSPGELTSSLTPLPQRAACAPFGTAPEVGAYFELAELPGIAYAPDSLSIEVDWQGLPTPKTDFPFEFASYYAGYIQGASPLVSKIASAAAASELTGIDVSHFQKTIDWPAVDPKTVYFAWIKATEGATDTDNYFVRNWEGAKAAGIARGAYHVLSFGTDPALQAAHFLSSFGRAYDGELPPALDVEAVPVGQAAAMLKAMSTWLEAVALGCGRIPVIYANQDTMQSLGAAPELAIYAKWVVDLSGGTAPVVPNGWQPYRFWQYGQSDRVSGVRGLVDLDRFPGDLAALNAFCRRGAAVNTSYTSDSFTVSAQALCADKWSAAPFVPDTGSEYLFVSGRGARITDSQRKFQIDLSDCSMPPERVRLRLEGPPAGFGKHLFASSVNAAVLENAGLLQSETLGAEKHSSQTPAKPAVKSEPPPKPAPPQAAIKLSENLLSKVLGRWYAPLGLVVDALGGLAGLVKRLFGHSALSSEKLPDAAAIALVTEGEEAATATAPTAVRPIPNPPFTPMTSRISLGFKLKAQDLYCSKSAAGSSVPIYNQVWHIASNRLIPTSNADDGGPGTAFLPALSGNTLYLTIQAAAPGDRLDLLWVAVGDGDMHGGPAPMWSAQNRSGGWSPITPLDVLGAREGHVRALDLTTTALLQITIPEDAAAIDGAGSIRLRICADSAKYTGMTFAIYCNGALAQRVATPSATDKTFPIPAATLSTLQPPVATVARVLQPTPGFGGRMAETPAAMLARVSERLRHKGRAWTAWDYERLTLAASDAVFAARCLSALKVDAGHPREAPGSVTLVLVPRIHTAGGGAQGFPPQFRPGELDDISRSLEPLMPPGARLYMRAATYQIFEIACEVRPNPLVPVPVVRRRLQDDLNAHTSAWFYKPELAERVPSAMPSAHALRHYIDSLDYIDDVLDCRLQPDAPEPLSAWSVPLSSGHHQITIV